MTSYLVKPGQQKDSPIRYTPPWNETEAEIKELEMWITSGTVVAACSNCPSQAFWATFRLGQWFVICQQCESEYGLMADGTSHEITKFNPTLK